MNSSNLTFASLITLIRENLKIFIIVAVAAIIAGIIFTGPAFITPMYQSVAVVYPVNIDPYSDESETEQLMQIFQASSVRDSIIEKYNLMDRYNIKPEKEGAKHELYELYHDLVVVSKTNFESVRLEVMDKDPEVAYAMANEVLKQVNVKANQMANEPAYGRMKALEKALEYQRSVMDSVDVLLSVMSREKNLLQYESQTRELMRGYLNILGTNSNTAAAEEVRGLMEDLQESGSTFQSLQYFVELATHQYDFIARMYLEERTEAFQELNYTNVVISPDVPDRKASPKRAVLVALILLSTLLVTAIVLIVKKD